MAVIENDTLGRGERWKEEGVFLLSAITKH